MLYDLYSLTAAVNLVRRPLCSVPANFSSDWKLPQGCIPIRHLKEYFLSKGQKKKISEDNLNGARCDVVCLCLLCSKR